jgi:glutathione reductase (NADPH)
MSADDEYDLVIIGGGSGGSATAKRAVGYGAKVCIIDRGVQRDASGKRIGAGIGGTCVNVGCVPKKLMWLAAFHRELIHGPTATAAGFSITGVDPAAVGFDWAGMKAKRDAEVARLNVIYESGWTKAGCKVIVGHATVAAKDTVKVALPDGSEQTLRTKHILIAVGGVPLPLPVKGGDLAIDSDGFFDLEAAPKKCLVIGAGYIAVEMAGILNALGTDTSLMFRGATLLRHGFDQFLVDTLMEELQAHGPRLLGTTEPTELVREADGTITAICTGPDGAEVRHGGFDVVLSAIGRQTCAGGLGLEQIGVRLSREGFVEVDEFQRTALGDSVLAVGDVTVGIQLTPVAIAAGRRLADRLFGGEPRARLEYETVPTVVFSHPPIGTIGLTQAQAEAKFGKDNVSTKSARFYSMLYTFNDAGHKMRTGLKLVLAGPEEKVVGLHMIGPNSDEMLQGFSVAVKMGATRRDFEAVVAIHPTISEEMVTFGGWGQDKTQTKPQLPPYLDGASPATGLAEGGGGAGL